MFKKAFFAVAVLVLAAILIPIDVRAQGDACAGLAGNVNPLLDLALASYQNGEDASGDALLAAALELLNVCADKGDCPAASSGVALLEEAQSAEDLIAVQARLNAVRELLLLCDPAGAAPGAKTSPLVAAGTNGDVFSAALQGVTTNDEWTPYFQDFNGHSMVLVPVGCFEMGIEDSSEEGPVHTVCFDLPFWIDEFEVTRGQYQDCVDTGVCDEMYESDLSDNHPVYERNWFRVSQYCEWRGARLPSEAEWEYAARGPDSLVYPWGNTFDSSLVISSVTNSDPEPVGSRPGGVSWVGAQDMAGNVWEWTNTLFDFSYPYDANDGREDTSDTESRRALRGGSYIDGETGVRPANRLSHSPTTEDQFDGFRCVMDAG